MKPDENSSWEYKPDDSAAGGSEEPADENNVAPPVHEHSADKAKTVSWTASEYIEHQRGAQWYVMLAAAIIVIAAGIYLLTKDYFATGAIIVVGIILGVFAGQKPRQVTYELGSSGLKIAEKSYSYSLFKSFSLIREGALNSVNFYPLKRFMPPISIYFDAKDEKRITNAIGDHLPYEERKLDSIDRLTRWLKI